MTDLFDRAAAQALGLPLALRPRPRSRFEPDSDLSAPQQSEQAGPPIGVFGPGALGRARANTPAPRPAAENFAESWANAPPAPLDPVIRLQAPLLPAPSPAISPSRETPPAAQPGPTRFRERAAAASTEVLRPAATPRVAATVTSPAEPPVTLPAQAGVRPQPPAASSMPPRPRAHQAQANATAPRPGHLMNDMVVIAPPSTPPRAPEPAYRQAEPGSGTARDTLPPPPPINGVPRGALRDEPEPALRMAAQAQPPRKIVAGALVARDIMGPAAAGRLHEPERRQGIAAGPAPGAPLLTPAPAIEITIGRLEIHAEHKPAPRAARPFEPHLDLAAYRSRRDRA